MDTGTLLVFPSRSKGWNSIDVETPCKSIQMHQPPAPMLLKSNSFCVVASHMKSFSELSIDF